VRRTGDGTGVLDATTVSSAAWLAGSGLLAYTWPAQLDHSLRDDWLDQQTETAFELADDLAGPAWSELSLPVDGVPMPPSSAGCSPDPPGTGCTSARTGGG
jgi:hypothetical protein